jgi:3-hydroxybutyryl-CoA dehydrogenase
VPTDCDIASDTGSLSITVLARALGSPERFMEMHSFKPGPASKLVETVTGVGAHVTRSPTTGDVTDKATTERGVAGTRMLGKNVIIVHDSPGFATSRLGVLLGLEAIRMLEEGVADAASTDRAMELGYRHPTGPRCGRQT